MTTQTLAPGRSLWRSRGLRHVLPAQALSDLGDGCSYVALAWLTLELTGSGVALGGVLATQAVPRALFTLVGGATSDRISPRVQMLASSLSRAAIMAMVATLTLTHGLARWQLYAAAAAFGAVDAFFQPARVSLLPSIIDKDTLEGANGLLSAASRTCAIAGPALGGLLVAGSGTGLAFLVDAACFLAVAALIGTLAKTTTRLVDGGTDGPSLAARIREGIRYFFADPRLRSVLAIDVAVTFAFAGPLTVGLAGLVRFRYAQNAAAFGILAAALAVGGLVGALAGGLIRVRPRLGLLIAALAGWLAFGMALLALAPSLPLALLLTFAMGFGTGFQSVFGLSWLQRNIDKEILGRVFSVDMVAGYAMGPMSLLLTGALLQHHLKLLYLGTAAVLAVTALGVLSSRTVRNM